MTLLDAARALLAALDGATDRDRIRQTREIGEARAALREACEAVARDAEARVSDDAAWDAAFGSATPDFSEASDAIRERDGLRALIEHMLGAVSNAVGDDRGMEQHSPEDAVRAAVESVVAERDEARQSLVERTAEREALAERVSALEEDVRDHLPEYVLEDGTGDAATARERIEYAGDEIRRLRRMFDVDRLVGAASMHGADDAVWRPGETRAECWARHIREAEERGARWALTHWTRRPFENAHTVAGREDEAARICAEARAKGGEHG